MGFGPQFGSQKTPPPPLCGLALGTQAPPEAVHWPKKKELELQKNKQKK